MTKPINAGDFNERITIFKKGSGVDGDGFKMSNDTIITKAWASIKTTSGYTLVAQGSDFENVTTRMLIRKPNVELSRKYLVLFKNRTWKIRYLNDIDEAGKFVELQVEEVRQNG